MNTKRDFTYFLLWLVATIVAAFLGARMLGVYEYYRLTDFGVMTEGTIIGLTPKQHSSVTYSYQVEQNLYRGGGFAGNINANIEDLREGQKVTVFYDSENPQNSCLGEPSGQYHSLLRGTALIAGIPSFFVLSIIIRRVIKQ